MVVLRQNSAYGLLATFFAARTGGFSIISVQWEKGMEEQATKKTVLSGIQPPSLLTLGNYLGALKNFVAMQEEFDENDKEAVMAFLRGETDSPISK